MYILNRECKSLAALYSYVGVYYSLLVEARDFAWREIIITNRAGMRNL